MESREEHYDFGPDHGNYLLPPGHGYNDAAMEGHIPHGFISQEQPEVGQADPGRNDTPWSIEPQLLQAPFSEPSVFGALSGWDLADTDGHPYSNLSAWQPYPKEPRPLYQADELRDPAQWSHIQQVQTDPPVINATEAPVLDKPSLAREASSLIPRSEGRSDLQSRQLLNTAPDARAGGEIRVMLKQNEFKPLESHGLQSQRPISRFRNVFAGQLPTGPSGSSNAFGPSAHNLVSTHVDDKPGTRQARGTGQHREIRTGGGSRDMGSDRKSSDRAILQAAHSFTSSPASTQSTTNSKGLSFVWDPESGSVFEETKSPRPQSKAQRAHRMAVRKAGGACAECKRKRRKCDHVLRRDNRGAGTGPGFESTNDRRQDRNTGNGHGVHSVGFAGDAIGIGGIFDTREIGTPAQTPYNNGGHQIPQQISPAASPLGMIQVYRTQGGLNPYGYTSNPVQMGNWSDPSPNHFQLPDRRPY